MKKYGILGYPAAHSLSPVMHNAGFKEMGLDAQYGVFEVPERDVPSFMESVKHEPISGLSVTVPYKEYVMQFMNEIDENVRVIGAMNTVVNKGGFLYGYNTDFLGSNRALIVGLGGEGLNGKKVVVVGAGGAARAVVYGVLKEGAQVCVMNRTVEKAEKISLQFSEFFGVEVGFCDLDKLEGGDILINSTSIWIDGDYLEDEKLPVFCQKDYVKDFELVMDIAYMSKEDIEIDEDVRITPLIRAAKKLEIPYVTADKMLLYQAVEQFKLWTGMEAPEEVMKRALENSF